MSSRRVFIVLLISIPLAVNGVKGNFTGSEDIPLISKCCPVGESPTLKDGCMKSNLTFNPRFWYPENSTPASVSVDLLTGFSCQYGKYLLEPHKDSMDEFHLLPNGNLLVPFLLADQNELSPYEYCLDSFQLDDGSTITLAMICFPPPIKDPRKEAALIIYPIGFLVSVPFLIAAAAIFLTSELRSIDGWILGCCIMCLALGYACFSCVQLWGYELEERLCFCLGYITQFFFHGCYFWINAMCFHCWRSLTKRAHLQIEKTQTNKIFFFYSLYSWGSPAILLTISILKDLMPVVPSSYIKLNYGTDVCWVQNDQATITYFYGPTTMLLGIDVILLFLTIKYLYLNSESRIDLFRDPAVNQRRQKFFRCLLLFGVTFLHWLLDVLSWSIEEPPQLWIVIDVLNTLQGVIILTVLIISNCKLRKAMWRKFQFFLKKEQSEHYNAPLNPV